VKSAVIPPKRVEAQLTSVKSGNTVPVNEQMLMVCDRRYGVHRGGGVGMRASGVASDLAERYVGMSSKVVQMPDGVLE